MAYKAKHVCSLSLYSDCLPIHVLEHTEEKALPSSVSETIVEILGLNMISR